MFGFEPLLRLFFDSFFGYQVMKKHLLKTEFSPRCLFYADRVVRQDCKKDLTEGSTEIGQVMVNINTSF